MSARRSGCSCVSIEAPRQTQKSAHTNLKSTCKSDPWTSSYVSQTPAATRTGCSIGRSTAWRCQDWEHHRSNSGDRPRCSISPISTGLYRHSYPIHETDLRDMPHAYQLGPSLRRHSPYCRRIWSFRRTGSPPWTSNQPYRIWTLDHLSWLPSPDFIKTHFWKWCV